MKIFIGVFLSIIYNPLIAQQHLSRKFENVIIDKNLENDLFSRDKQSILNFPSKMNIYDSSTGKSDSLIQSPKVLNIIINADIVDSQGGHFNFDNCKSYLKKDTLVIQFQNNSSFLPKPLFLDKLIVYVTKGKFCSQYINVGSP